jgi:DNA-binding MarR family transcriptional regulator
MAGTELKTWRALLHAHFTVREALMRAVPDQHGVRGPQFGVLRAVSEAGDEGIRLTDISNRLLVSCAHVTGLVDRLEAIGLIVREPHPSDRRALLAKLTPLGREVVDDVIPRHDARAKAIFSVLSTEERAQLVGLLDRLSDAARKLEGEEPRPRNNRRG